MTLHKAIEAARGALKMASDNEFPMAKGKIRKSIYDNAISTLPAKPLSEGEILRVIYPKLDEMKEWETAQARTIIRTLRDTDHLYVAEGE
jgi:hypothetical protein